jgi:hypothetical protein
MGAKFNIYAVPSSDPNSFTIKANVHFMAPAGSTLKINLDRAYHAITHLVDGQPHNATDYGHLFTIEDIYGNIIATGVLNGVNFTTVSMGITEVIPVPEQSTD